MKALAFTLLAACGGSSDFCARLGDAPDCRPEAEQICRQAIEQQERDTPRCTAALEELVDCVGELPQVGCSGSSSAYAIGDGRFAGPTNFTLIGDADLVVNDSHCSTLKEAYDSCAGIDP